MFSHVFTFYLPFYTTFYIFLIVCITFYLIFYFILLFTARLARFTFLISFLIFRTYFILLYSLFPHSFRRPFLSHSFHSHSHSCSSPLPRSSPSVVPLSLLTLSISVIHYSPLPSSSSIPLILSPIVLSSLLFVLHISNTCSHDCSRPPHTLHLLSSSVPQYRPPLISFSIRYLAITWYHPIFRCFGSPSTVISL